MMFLQEALTIVACSLQSFETDAAKAKLSGSLDFDGNTTI